MTTKARIAALQWFHERGEVAWFRYAENPPGNAMRRKMLADGQLKERRTGMMQPIFYSLTDKGRQDLHEATK